MSDSGSRSMARVGRSSQRYNTTGQRLIAGIVPVSEDLNYVLLAQSTRRKGWTLPKGGWESGETCEEAASREAWEEAGITVQIDYTLPPIEKKRPAKASKDSAVYYFYQATVLEMFDKWPESRKRERKWFTFEQALEQLSSRRELQQAIERSTMNRITYKTPSLQSQETEREGRGDNRQQQSKELTGGGGNGSKSVALSASVEKVDKPSPSLGQLDQLVPRELDRQVNRVVYEEEGIACFQITALGIVVSRREDNDMINGTQLLKVGEDRMPMRDSMFKHVEPQHVQDTGPVPLRGVWIPLEHAKLAAYLIGFIDIVRPLFSDGLKVLSAESSRSRSIEPALESIEESALEFSRKPGKLLSEAKQTDELPQISSTGTVALSMRPGRLLDSEYNEGTVPKETDIGDDSSSLSSLPSLDDEEGVAELLSTEERKTFMLDCLMRYFYDSLLYPIHESATREYSIAHDPQSSQLTNDGGGSNSSGVRPREAVGPSVQAFGDRGRESQRKRPAGDDNDDDEDGSQDRRSKQSRGGDFEDSIHLLPAKRLACPYFKNNPNRRHPSRSCVGPGWVAVHRIKEHLYRCHARPVSCPRCHEVFDTEQEKSDHLAAEVRCENQIQSTPLEGFDSSQEKLLRSRKKRQKQKQTITEEEKWVDVYLILFPDSDPETLPSPYYDHVECEHEQGNGSSSELARYEMFLRQELPSRVRQQLETRIEEALNPIEEALRAQLVEIVRDTQLELFHLYKSSRTTDAAEIGSSTGPSGAHEHRALDQQISEVSPAIDGEAESSRMEGQLGAPSLGSTLDWELAIDDQLTEFCPMAPSGEAYLDDNFDGLLFALENQSAAAMWNQFE